MTHTAPQVNEDRIQEIQARLRDMQTERRSLMVELEKLGVVKKPARHGTPWSDEEKALVAAMYREGLSLDKIAQKQERSRGSILSVLMQQGYIALEAPAPEAASLNAPEAAVTNARPIKIAAAPKPQPAETKPGNGKRIAKEPARGAPKITPEFEQAFDLLEHTNANIFLTGKAGTGKSTFLNYFRERTSKKIAVVAPTGIAALNVGAQTIHSLFRFKPGFIDLKAIKPNRSRVLREIDLLIIDEISMVRADIFDGIDRSLKLARKNNKPFGGVQICAIGDLYQLPPVVTRAEKNFFAQFYNTAFFFGAEAYREAPFKMVQFTTIHRQNDAAFIQILNAIRSGACDEIELEALNTRLYPKAAPAPGTLVLTTTNDLAEDINRHKLEQLPQKLEHYQGVLSGNFGMKGGRLPAPENLALKVGAQVMFLKNDSESRWVNGTIGIVEKLAADLVTVRIGDESHEVEAEKWKAIGYEFDDEEQKIVEKEQGTYTQFPLTLAWAITIHKSQGKTLERVIIDLGDGAFAAGQLYVALSRCKSFSGIALKQRVTEADIRCDREVISFMQTFG